MTIGQKIRTLRKRHGLTQPQLAQAARVAQGDLSKYENDRMAPSEPVARRIYEALGETYEASPTVDWRSAGLVEVDPLARVRPTDWIVHDFLPRSAITLLAAKYGTGKSIVAQHWAVTAALAKAQGLSESLCAGYQVNAGTALIIDAENGANLLKTRLQSMGLTLQAKDYCRTVVGNQFDMVEDITFFRSLLNEVRPDMLVLDTYTSVFSGSPSSPTKARLFLRTLRSLTEDFSFGALLLHHTDRAGDKYTGSFAIGQSVDAVFVLSHTEADLSVMTCDKMRPVAMPGPQAFRVTAHGLALPAPPEASKGDEFSWSPEMAEGELTQWADQVSERSHEDNDTGTTE